LQIYLFCSLAQKSSQTNNEWHDEYQFKIIKAI